MIAADRMRDALRAPTHSATCPCPVCVFTPPRVVPVLPARFAECDLDAIVAVRDQIAAAPTFARPHTR